MDVSEFKTFYESSSYCIAPAKNKFISNCNFCDEKSLSSFYGLDGINMCDACFYKIEKTTGPEICKPNFLVFVAKSKKIYNCGKYYDDTNPCDHFGDNIICFLCDKENVNIYYCYKGLHMCNHCYIKYKPT